MRLSEATALVDLEVREQDPHEDLDALCSLAEQAQQFSPIVGLEQLDKKTWSGRTLHQPESLLLDITGIGPLFGGEEQLVTAVEEWLQSKSYFGCLGIAETIGGAWALANFATRRPNAARLAKTEKSPAIEAPQVSQAPSVNASEESETVAETTEPIVPDCRHVIAPSRGLEAAIGDLSLSALRLAPETVSNLSRLGISRIFQLASLPRDGMATRLGEDLLKRWDQALGIKSEPVITLYSQPEWCLEETLEFPTHDRELIQEIVRQLSVKLSKGLAKRGEGALRMVCRLDFTKTDIQATPPMILQMGLFRPTNDAEHLGSLLSGQLEQELTNIGEQPLWRVALQATLTAPMTWRQVDLFDSGEVASRNEMARLVDALSSRLGRKQILKANTRRDAQPEMAFQLRPLTGRKADGSEQDTVKRLSSRIARKRAEPSRNDPLRRPTHLLPKPIAIQVVLPGQDDAAAATPFLATAPSKFQYQGTWHEVEDARGPERLESGWWRGPSARRDYYRVATNKGSWWWLYRDLQNGSWFLHGIFD